MNLFNKEIKNWLSNEEMSFLKRNNENYGLINFYSKIIDRTKDTAHIDDFPTLQSTFSEKLIYEHDIKKIIFYIDYLKSESFLEIIPRLTISDQKITALDHVIINQNSDKTINTDHLIDQAITESTEQAYFLLKNKYFIDQDLLAKQIANKDPDYVLFLPYFFLMEMFRTEIDPKFLIDSHRFKTIRRDKQNFLNKIYENLINREILTFDNRTNDFKKLHTYFHFAWPNIPDFYNFFIKHYKNIFNILYNEFLTAPFSHFHYENFNNEKVNNIINKINEYGTSQVTLNEMFVVSKNVLISHQKLLLSKSEKIDKNTEYRFLRNILSELILQNFTTQNIISLQLKNLENLNQLKDTGSNKNLLSKILIGFPVRATELTIKRIEKFEDLRETLSNPANYNIFFGNHKNFQKAIYPFSSLIATYLNYKKHFTTIFPKLNDFLTDEEQLLVLLNSFRDIGLLVHIYLPENDCRKLSIDTNWYAEAAFWNNKNEKKIAEEHFRKEYKYSDSIYKKRINEEWLNYLKLNLQIANEKTINNINNLQEKNIN